MNPRERIERIRRNLREPLPGDVAKRRMWLRPFPPPAAHELAEARQAAVLVLLYPRDAELGFPLMRRRSAPGDVHSGQISLPGGGQEGDETAVEAALRESHEELGIEPATVEVLGSLSPHWIPVSGYCVHPVVGTTEAEPAFRPDPIEVERVVPTSVEQLLTPGCEGTFQRDYRGSMREVPCWRLPDGILWGATAMILAELLAVLERPSP